MSQFTKPLLVELIGKNKFRVAEEFEYHVGEYPSQEIITVPVGQETDFASVPRFFWALIGPIDRHGKAAVVHDYCYRNQYDEKKRCDDIFLEAMIVLGVRKWKLFCIYWSVRLFAWFAWWGAKKRFQKRSAQE